MTLGAVVVGTGFGCVTHVRALRAAGFDIVALVGRDPQRTAERAQLFEVERAMTSLSDALALPGVDAVTIATPPHTHAELALEAIAAGRHVLCEKPLARDVGEARAMLAAAEDAGIVHLVGTEFRWDAGQATLARAVASGVVGEPRLVTVMLHVPVLAAPDVEVPAWWADSGSGGGWLGAHASQVIDQVRVTAGEIAAVSASLPRLNESALDAEDSFVVHLRMRSGATGVLQSSAADQGPMLIETRVAGSTGTAWIDGLSAAVWVTDRDGTRAAAAERRPPGRARMPRAVATSSAADDLRPHDRSWPRSPPYTRLAEIFRDRILGAPSPAAPAPATFHDGVAGMAALDAIRASAAANGAWVDVDVVPTPVSAS